MTNTFPWKTVWMTGASGGIGAELATRLAKQGVTVAATARDAAKLKALAEGEDNIKTYPADVLDPDALKATIASIDKDIGAIDLALLGAGLYVPFDIRAIDLDGFHRTMRVNVDGVINAVAAVLPGMLVRGQGHIAIMGSLFGYSGWPGNGAYGASKAAVINLAESLKLELEGTGVDLTIINPGFVDTALNAAYERKKHYVMKPDKAARRILEKLGGRPYEIAFPGRVEIFLKTARALPHGAGLALVRWFAGRD